MELLPPITNDSSDRMRDVERLCGSPPILDQFLVLHQVKRATGKSKSSIYEDIRSSKFPAPVRISKGRVAWPASEILAWQRRCIKARCKAAKAANSDQNNNEKGPPAKELDGPKLSSTTSERIHSTSSNVERPSVQTKGNLGHELEKQTS